MDLRDLRLIVSRYLPVAFLAFAICVAIGAALAFLPQKTYRTSAVIEIGINNDAELAGGAVPQVEFETTALTRKATSRPLREDVREDVPEQFQGTFVALQAVADDSIMILRGTSSSPQAAAVWVNATADRLVEEQSPNSAAALSVLEPAPVKATPISPNVEPILAVSVVVGLIAGLFSTLAADRLKQAFDTNQTVRDRLGTTVLGEIPVMKRRTERRRPIITLLHGPHASRELVSAFEAIRTKVEFRMAQLGADRIAIVSLSRETGKSTTTAGLAYAMAVVGRQVVAIEGDLRRPGLVDQLNVRPRRGLGDIVAFGMDEAVLQETEHPRLQVLPAGVPVGRAADVVSTTLPGVLDWLGDGSRTILIDTPPMRGAPEASTIVSLAKHVILVVNNSTSDFANLAEAIERIDDAGGSLLGVVVNRVPRRRVRRDQYPSYVARTMPYAENGKGIRERLPVPRRSSESREQAS